MAQRGIEQSLDVVALRHVAMGELRASARGTDCGGHPLAGITIQVVDEDRAAFGGEALRDALAEARRGSGDDRDLVLQAFAHGVPRSYPCLIAIVLRVVNPSSASKPFSRP